MGIAFKIYVRCANCQKDYACRIEPPEADDAPTDADELLESKFLSTQRFMCRDCESPIATVIGIKELRDEQLVRTQALCS